MGGHPRSFSPRNTGASAGAAREQRFEESTSNNPREMVSLAAGLENTNPSRAVEIDSVILGAAPIFHEVDNVEKESHAYVQHKDSSGQIPDLALQNNMVEQSTRLESFDVAMGGLVDEVSGPVCNRLKKRRGSGHGYLFKAQIHMDKD
nr:hypothetical protein CFP56_25569 [Quercus suber]